MGPEDRGHRTVDEPKARLSKTRRLMKRRGLPLIALLAVIPLAGCTVDQSWSATTGGAALPSTCHMAVGHQVDPLNSGISRITYGTKVTCTRGEFYAPISITGYSQIGQFPLIGFGSGKWGQATVAGSVDVLRGQSYTFHGAFTLKGFGGYDPTWPPVSGCTRSGYPDAPSQPAILKCTFSHTIHT